MAKLTTLDQDVYKKILVYGESGAGKTVLAGQLAERFNLVWLDGENGWESLTNEELIPKEWQDRIDLVSIPDNKDFPMFAETVSKVLTGAECKIDNLTGKVNHPLREKESRPTSVVNLGAAGKDTVLVIDSLSQLSNSCLFRITKGKPDDYKCEWDDWGNLRVMLTKILTYVQSARFHIVCLTHPTIGEDEITKTDKIAPSCGTRAFSLELGKFFSDIAYLEVQNKKYIGTTNPLKSSKLKVKSRKGIDIAAYEKLSLLPLFNSTPTK